MMFKFVRSIHTWNLPSVGTIFCLDFYLWVSWGSGRYHGYSIRYKLAKQPQSVAVKEGEK